MTTVKPTDQMNAWAGDFGREYTDRNACSREEQAELYRAMFGVTCREIAEEFTSHLPRDARILEVGCNVGNQLRELQDLGFTQLYGVELQPYAVQVAKARTTNVNILVGSAFDLPFKDGYFDLVFTSGVLIHIAPGDIGTALDEMHRCSKSGIWGHEYWAEQYQEVNYRGADGLLWKTDFAQLFLDRFDDLELVKERKLTHVDGSGNVDSVYYLRRN